MLEPLVAHVLRAGVPGDIVEAGVYKGGISIVLATMLRARGELGDEKRRVFLADSFEGLPPPLEYKNSFNSHGHAGSKRAHLVIPRIKQEWGVAKLWAAGMFRGTQADVVKNVARCLPEHAAKRHHRLSAGGDQTARSGAAAASVATASSPQSGALMTGSTGTALTVPTGTALSLAMPDGVHMIRGFFNETLPGPVRRTALLRADSDMYASIYETLLALYPLLSSGGFVVFDDWKFVQARYAIETYRKVHKIKEPILSASIDGPLPFRSLDRMVFWQKA